MGQINTTLATRAQQVAELEQQAAALVLGKVLSDVVNGLVEEGDALAAEVRAIDEVTDKDTSDLATDILQRRLGWIKRADAALDPYVKAAHAVHKKFTALRATVTESGQLAADTLKQRRDKFLDALEREAQRKAAEAAAEQRKLEEKARQDAAKEAKALGAPAKAVQQILTQPINLAPPPVAPVAETAGNYKREHWVWAFEGTPEDTLRRLVKEAAKDDRWLAYLAVNVPALNAETKKKSLAKVPGVRFYDEAIRVDRAK